MKPQLAMATRGRFATRRSALPFAVPANGQRKGVCDDERHDVRHDIERLIDVDDLADHERSLRLGN
jgi:hypothetical protein